MSQKIVVRAVVTLLFAVCALVPTLAQMPNPYGLPISLENAKKAAAPALAEAAKNKSVSAMAAEVTTSASGDEAPPMSLTAVCDMPPATGKPCARPVAILAAPSAVSSCWGSMS